MIGRSRAHGWEPYAHLALGHVLRTLAQGLRDGAVQHLQMTLLTGIHAAFLAARLAAVLGLLVLLFLPGGSAREHAVRETVSTATADAALRALAALLLRRRRRIGSDRRPR